MSGLDHYILDEARRVVAVDLMTWAMWLEEKDHRRVAEDFTKHYRVSTVFLGLDMGFGRSGPPILFETMVFERKAEIREVWGRLYPVHPDLEQWRYASWDDAVTGHQAILRRYQKAEADAVETRVP